MEKDEKDSRDGIENYPLFEEEIEKGIDEDSIYSEDIRDELLEDDELTPEEVGFMKGYDEAYT